ncbi:YihY/virulence factor BrkB family protein [Propionibacterium sp.]|uniref:YihY/virulence factor BrkB family protein n=1 Tax=Propionibacterium sp. TaxID=1977903 RepID=UPI0039EAAA96
MVESEKTSGKSSVNADEATDQGNVFTAEPPATKLQRMKAFVQRIGKDRITDQAAALTYYTVFSAFPMLIALISVLKLVGQDGRVQPIMDQFIAKSVPDQAMATTLTEVVQGFLDSGGAGLGLVIGILLALWSASGYVGAFARAANSLHDVEESRGFVKLKAQQLALTAMMVVFMIVMVVAFSAGPLVRWLANMLALGQAAESFGAIWTWLRWPVIFVLMIIMVSALFRFAPDNIGRKVPLISRGSVTAIIVSLLAVVGFNFYVSMFGNYQKTYGALAGVIIALLLIWIVSTVLLVGVLIDDERTKALPGGGQTDTKLG